MDALTFDIQHCWIAWNARPERPRVAWQTQAKPRRAWGLSHTLHNLYDDVFLYTDGTRSPSACPSGSAQHVRSDGRGFHGVRGKCGTSPGT